MANPRNLALRPAKPALGNGHVQRLTKRALQMLDRDATTREVLDWTCGRKLLLLRQPLAPTESRHGRTSFERPGIKGE
jgi:hypothetical protein